MLSHIGFLCPPSTAVAILTASVNEAVIADHHDGLLSHAKCSAGTSPGFRDWSGTGAGEGWSGTGADRGTSKKLAIVKNLHSCGPVHRLYSATFLFLSLVGNKVDPAGFVCQPTNKKSICGTSSQHSLSGCQRDTCTCVYIYYNYNYSNCMYYSFSTRMYHSWSTCM